MWTVDGKEAWYAIFVLVGQEDEVKHKLQNKFEDNLKFIVPKRKLRERKDGDWKHVQRILFPGYILAKGKITVENYYDMKGTFGMIRLLRGEGKPLKISEKEIEVLSYLMDNNNGEIGFSRVVEEGEKVIVIDGPLIGFEGMIIKIDKRKGRAKVRMSFLGHERVAELGIEMVR